MLRKKPGELIVLLMAASLFGVGFSAFVIADGPTSIDVKVDTADVVDLRDSVNIDSFDSFTYCPYGFVNDGKIENKTNIKGQIRFTLKEIRKGIPSLNSNKTFSFRITLSENSKDLDLFSSCLIDSSIDLPSASFNPPTLKYSDNPQTDGFYTTIGNFTEVRTDLDSILITVDYMIDVSKSITKDFKTDIYEKLDSVNLNLQVELGDIR